MTESIDLIRINYPAIDTFEQYVSKGDKYATKHLYISDNVYIYCQKGDANVNRLFQFNEKINKTKKVSHHQLRMSYIYS